MRYTLDKAYQQVINEFGLGLAEILRQTRLPEDIFGRDDATVTAEEYYRFVDTIGCYIKNDEEMIRMMTMDGIETFSPPIFAAYCSSDMIHCVNRLAQFKRIVGPLRLSSRQDATTYTVILSSAEDVEIPPFMVEMELVFMVNMFSKATKAVVRPISVSVHEQPKNHVLKAYLGVEPVIGDEISMTFNLGDAKRHFISENETMFKYFEPELNRRLSEMEVDDSMAARVRSALVEILPAGESSVDAVARKLFLSKRTLQRRLAEENTSFQKQLNHVRELLAKNYLEDSNLRTEDIAYLLGYQDLASFNRAFNLWTGMSTAHFKERIKGNIRQRK